MKTNKELWWIGVDLDGTLAVYDEWVSPEHIGEPVVAMMDRVKDWIAAGYRVKIFTARANIPSQVVPIANWLEENGIGELEVTNVKDYLMVELWDDRCVQVVKNTGIPVAGSATRVPIEGDRDG